MISDNKLKRFRGLLIECFQNWISDEIEPKRSKLRSEIIEIDVFDRIPHVVDRSERFTIRKCIFRSELQMTNRAVSASSVDLSLPRRLYGSQIPT